MPGATVKRSSADPARLFLRGGALGEGIEWAFWLGALVWWIDDLNLSPLQLVLLGTVLEATILVSETPTGVVADLYSRKWSIIIAHALMAVAFAWTVASRNFWLLLPGQMLFGFAWTFKSGADVAWVTDELRGVEGETATDHRVEQLILRRHRFGIAAGMVCVTIMMLVGVQSIRLAVVTTAVAKLAQALWYAVAMTEQHFEPQHETSSFTGTLQEGLGVVRGKVRLRSLVVVAVILGLSGEALDRFAFIRFNDGLEEDQESVVAMGILFLVLAAAGIVVNTIISRRLASASAADASGIIAMAVVLFAIAAAGALVIAFTALPVAIGIGLMLQDATRESLDPVMESWTNREAPSNVRATVHSLIGQTMAVGGIGGGLALGALAEVAGISVALIISGALLAVGGLVARRSH